MKNFEGAGPYPQHHQTPPRIARKAASKALRLALDDFRKDFDAFRKASTAWKAWNAETAETVEGDRPEEREATPAPVPPRLVIRGEAGLGKTEAALDLIRPLVQDDLRILYLVPSISLADEFKERALAAGIAKTFVVRGRSQPNPEQPGQTMCRKAEIAETVANLGYNVTETLCRNKAGEECEYAPTCAYFQQLQERRKGGGLLVGAHNYLSLAMEMLKEDRIHLLIVDESFWQSMVRGSMVEIDRFRTRRGPNGMHRTYRPRKGETMRSAEERFLSDSAEFDEIHTKAVEALDAADREDRQPTLADFRRQGLSSGDCRFAAGIEYTRLGSAEITPAMTSQDQREILKEAVMREAFSLARFWKCLAAELETDRQSTPISVRTVKGMVNPRSGELQNVVAMDYSADARFQGTPVLLLDASADRRIMDRFYPGAGFVEIAAEWNAVRVRQVVDWTGSKTAFANPANRDRLRLVGMDLADQMRDRLGDPKKRPLVVCQKQVEDAWREEKQPFAFVGMDAPKDAAFAVAHFGDIRGKDDWKHCGALIVAGRIEPSPAALERMARAVFFKDSREIAELRPEPIKTASSPLKAPPRERIVLPHRETVVTARDGSRATVSVSFHPDDRADAILRQIREGELAQAIARCRPVHRDASNPCEVLVLTSVPLDVQPDTLTTWNGVVPGRVRQMEMRGVVPDLSCDVADAYPDLFRTAAAVRQAAGRERKCDDSYMSSFYGECHTFTGSVRVSFRREGNRRERHAGVSIFPGDSPETVAQRVKEALPDAYSIIVLGALPDPVEAAVAASDAADDLAFYVEEVEARGDQIWWRPPLRSVTRPAQAVRAFRPAWNRPPDPGATVSA